MAKPRKNKAGLHKKVLSVLGGVHIPQGVRNWRPPEKCGPDRPGDPSTVPESNISSVFKGVPVAPSDAVRSPAGQHLQNDCAEVSPVETPNDRETSRSELIKQLDWPGESSAKAERTKQPESVNRVAYYRDPLEESATGTLWRQIRGNFFAPGEWLRHLFRRFSTKKG